MFNEEIARIRLKLSGNGVVMGAALSEEELCVFERENGISLPDEYRAFLSCVGNGCEMLGFRLKRLNELTVDDDTRREFGLCDALVWEELDISREELSERTFGGRLELIDLGDGMSFELIVGGSCRGEVWCFTDVGAQPCCPRLGFLGWFEKWLDDGDDVDYF